MTDRRRARSCTRQAGTPQRAAPPRSTSAAPRRRRGAAAPSSSAWRCCRRRAGGRTRPGRGSACSIVTLRPVDVQLLGDQHRQHRLDALADLRVLGDDGDAAIGGDRDERGRCERRRRRGARRLRLLRPRTGPRHAEASMTPPPASAETRRNARRVTSPDDGGRHRRTSCWPARPALGAVLPPPFAAAFLIASRMRR